MDIKMTPFEGFDRFVKLNEGKKLNIDGLTPEEIGACILVTIFEQDDKSPQRKMDEMVTCFGLMTAFYDCTPEQIRKVGEPCKELRGRVIELLEFIKDQDQPIGWL